MLRGFAGGPRGKKVMQISQLAGFARRIKSVIDRRERLRCLPTLRRRTIVASPQFWELAGLAFRRIRRSIPEVNKKRGAHCAGCGILADRWQNSKRGDDADTALLNSMEVLSHSRASIVERSRFEGMGKKHRPALSSRNTNCRSRWLIQ